MDQFRKAMEFIYRNARPLDLARWQYHLENGSREAVLRALSYYQNPDGGFGHALEPDCFNPASAPVQTWQAAEILHEIQFRDRSHPIIQGILKYLESGAHFSGEHAQWKNTVPGNNDYPHAIWWEHHAGNEEYAYNPTACLAGFILFFADRDSSLYQKGREIAEQAYDYFIRRAPFEEQHVTACYLRMYEYCIEAGVNDLFDMEQFRTMLTEQINLNICRDTDKWGREYVGMPSDFLTSKNSMFYSGNEEIAGQECEFLRNSQLADGSWAITWQWGTPYREFELSANWWRAYKTIKAMCYLKEFGGISLSI